LTVGKKLLLISAQPDDQAFGTAVAREAELEAVIEPDVTKACALLASGGDAETVIMVDVSSDPQYQKFEKAIQDSVGLLSDRLNANAIHFLSSDPLEKVQYLVQSPLFGHFIQRHYGNPEASGVHYGRLVKAAVSGRAFGLGTLLKPGAKIQVVKLQLSSQKQDAVEAIKNYLLALKFQSRMATVIANGVDEIIMNAMFDAPTDDVGRPLYTLTSRSTVLKLEGKAAVEMHVGFDGECVAITAVDLYGSLDKVKLLSHISKIYTEEEYKVKTSVAGAGIGLATVFRSGGSFFFASESRSRTEVTVFFRRTDNYREFREQFHFLSTQFYF
jgi:hypothetical protein